MYTVVDGNGTTQTFGLEAPSAMFTRPANTIQYTLGDLVANSVTAGSVVPMAFQIVANNGQAASVMRARVSKTNNDADAPVFRLHLFNASPTVTNGDNGAFLPNGATSYIGYIDVTTDVVFSDGDTGVGTPPGGATMSAICGGALNVIYGLLEARSVYTPTSGEVFTVTLEIDRR